MKKTTTKCKFIQIHLKLFMEFATCPPEIYPLLKLKLFSHHAKTLELYDIDDIPYNCKLFIFGLLKFFRYLVNIDKITGSFHRIYDNIESYGMQAYKPNIMLLQRFKNIKINKFCSTLIVDGKDLILKKSKRSRIYSCDFTYLFPILDIIPLINLKLNLKSLMNKRVSFKDFERLKHSLRELSLILNDDHPDLNELQSINCLHDLKHLSLEIETYNLWKLEDLEKIADIIHGLPITSLEIKINRMIMSSSSINVIYSFPENLLIEISYLDNLEDLTLRLLDDIRFCPKSYNTILRETTYKHYKNKIQFAKLKKMSIECASNTNFKMIIKKLVANNGIKLNNIKSFKLHEDLRYILKNKDNIIFNNMNNLTYLELYSSEHYKILDDLLLKNMNNFFNGIYNLINLEYLDITCRARLNPVIIQKSLMIMNYLYNLKTCIINWRINADDNIMNEYEFILWLQNNLKCNDSIKILKLTVLPIESIEVLWKFINIIKRKYKNVCKFNLTIIRTSENDVNQRADYDESRNNFGNLFDELCITYIY